MTQSNRLRVHWFLFAAEIVIFVATAVVMAYLAQNNIWVPFFWVAGVSSLLYIVVKILDAWPRAKELLFRDSVASNIAVDALPYGIEQYFNMQAEHGQNLRNKTTQQAAEQSQNMWLCANSGASYLDPGVFRHWTVIKKRLDAGAHFRVVLLDPFSPEKALRNRVNLGGDQQDHKINLPNLVKLHNSYPTLDIRFVKYGMHATVFATEQWLFFDPYHVGRVGERIENRSFCLKIKPTQPADGVGFYQLFKAHFESLWLASDSFEDWAAAAQDKLPPDLTAIKPRLDRL
jgi:hypothetical protein